MMLYGTTAYNRIINASPPDGGSDYAKQQSGDNALCAVLLRHNLPALQTCGLLIRAGKSSFITRTLSASFANF
jgi:hypothetical protein